MKKMMQMAAGFVFCAVLAVSCSKNGFDKTSQAEALDQLNSSSGGGVGTLSVSCVGDSIIGNCATPSGGSWGAIDYDLSIPDRGLGGQIQFVDRFNASLQVTSGYYAYIYDSSAVTACNVSRAQLAFSSTFITSGNVGFNTTGAPGWYNYTLMTPTVTPNRVVVVTTAATRADIADPNEEVFVLKLTNIGYQMGSCNPGNFQGLLSFTVNEL